MLKLETVASQVRKQISSNDQAMFGSVLCERTIYALAVAAAILTSSRRLMPPLDTLEQAINQLTSIYIHKNPKKQHHMCMESNPSRACELQGRLMKHLPQPSRLARSQLTLADISADETSACHNLVFNCTCGVAFERKVKG